MTTEAVAPPTTTKTRRTLAALEAFHIAKAAEAKAKQELKLKKALEKLAVEVQALAVLRTQDPKIGQAASLLQTAAAAITPKVPQ